MMKEDNIENLVYNPKSYLFVKNDEEHKQKHSGRSRIRRSSSFRNTVHNVGEGIRSLARKTKSLENILHPHSPTVTSERRGTMPELRQATRSTPEVRKAHRLSLRDAVMGKEHLRKTKSATITERESSHLRKTKSTNIYDSPALHQRQHEVPCIKVDDYDDTPRIAKRSASKDCGNIERAPLSCNKQLTMTSDIDTFQRRKRAETVV